MASGWKNFLPRNGGLFVSSFSQKALSDFRHLFLDYWLAPGSGLGLNGSVSYLFGSSLWNILEYS